jgi:hypothetical protein
MLEGDDPKPLEPAPGKTAFDYAVTVARVGGLVFPFLGPATTFFDLATAPIRSKRMSNWCEQVRLGLNDVNQQVKEMTPEKLATSEEFISAFAQATQAALRTHQKEKLEALRNAVLNTAINKVPDDNRRAVFLSLIDRLAPAHMNLLEGLHNSTIPRRGSNDYGYNEWEQNHRYIAQQSPDVYRGVSFLMLFVRDSVPLLAKESESFIKTLLGELYTAGLITIAPTDSEVPSSFQKLLTPIGIEFLHFIAPPDIHGLDG